MDSSSPVLWWVGLLVLVVLVVLFVWWVWCGCCTTSTGCLPPACPPACPTSEPVAPSPPAPAAVAEPDVAAQSETQVITGTNLGNVRAVTVPDDASAPTTYVEVANFSVSPDGTTLTYIVPSVTTTAAVTGEIIAKLLPRADSASTAVIDVLHA